MTYKLSDTYKSIMDYICLENHSQRQIRKREIRKTIVRLSHAKCNSNKQKAWISRLIMCQIKLLEYLKNLDSMGFNKD